MISLNVLIVDSDPVSVKLLTTMLQKAGCNFNFTESSSAVNAASILKANQNFDIIIVDLNLSGIDGIELLRIIKAEDQLNSIPVVITTSDDTRKNEAIGFGASSFLVKPISLKTLQEKFKDVLSPCES